MIPRGEASPTTQNWFVSPQQPSDTSYNASLHSSLVDWTDIDTPSASWDGAIVYDGILWVVDGGKIQYSTDGGASFTDHANLPNATYANMRFLNGSDKIVVWKSSNLLYSTNNGSTWTSGLNPPTGGTFVDWSITVDQLGYVYAGIYSDTANDRHIIYRSVDYGATWSEVYNQTGRHVHEVAFDSYTNRLWVGLGDKQGYGSTPYDSFFKYSDDQGATWTTYSYLMQPTAFVFTPNYIVMEEDSDGKISRIKKSDMSYEIVGNIQSPFNFVYAEGMMYDSTNDVIYMQGYRQSPTDYSVWISPDEGSHWYKVHNQSGILGRITGVDDAGYLYFGKGYRLRAFSSSEAKHLTFSIGNDGSRDTDQAISFERYLLSNISTTVSVYQEPLEDVTVTFEGVSTNNVLANPSWENDLTSWTVDADTGSSITVDTSEVYHGSKSIYVKRVGGAGWCYITSDDVTGIVAGNTYYFKTFYTNANTSYSGYYTYAIVQWKNETATLSATELFRFYDPLNGTWIFKGTTKVAPATATRMYIRIFGAQDGAEGYFDAFTVYDVSNLANNMSQLLKATFPTDAGLQNTTDPSVSFGGTTVSYSGSLSNGTQSSATSVSGTFSETISISSVSIDGSTIVKIIVAGNRVIDSDWIISDLTQGKNQWSFSVYGLSGETSTTKVYSDKGKPRSVEGADDWSWDPSGYVTITVVHQSSRTVTIGWSGGASGIFSLRVHVSQNSLPYLGAFVLIDGENKSTDLLGNAYFNLAYGSYDVTVFCGDLNETRRGVLLSGDMSLGFDFNPPVYSDRSLYLVLIVPFGVILVAFVMFTLWRKQ